MATITLRSVKGSPLTNTEVDNNFINLNAQLNAALPASSYTAADVLAKLKTVDGAGSGLSADTLQGYSVDTADTPGTLVLRNSNGDFHAGTITAGAFYGPLTGNVTGNLTGTVTGNASNVNGIVAILNGGTGAADATTARANLGLGTIATQSATSVAITGGSISLTTPLGISSGGTGTNNAASARIALGLNIGADVQPFNNVLTVLSSVTPATDTAIYFTGTGTANTHSFTSFGRSLVAAASTAAAQSVLGLTISAQVQAWSTMLDSITALGSNGIIARTAAGLATARTITSGTGISITNGDGVAGNPTISVVNGVYTTDTGTVTNTMISSVAATKVTGLSTVATTGAYSDLTGKPSLATVATSGAYSDLTGKPSLATVATSGSYSDLTNKPSIPAGQVNSDWNSVGGVTQILNKPTLATVATSGSYTDLVNKPSIPTVPTLVSAFTNDAGYITAAQMASKSWVNFDGTGNINSNMTIYASYNVASVYKNAVGDYTVTFTTPLTDGNYAKQITTSGVALFVNSDSNYNGGTPQVSAPTASSFRFWIGPNATTSSNAKYISATVFR